MARRTRGQHFPDVWKISAVSLGDELESIITALEAVDVLMELSPGDASRLVGAVVMLTQRRLRMLRRVVIGELDAAVLLDKYNSRAEPEPHEDGDVLLSPRRK